jgi:hypothetical protein
MLAAGTGGHTKEIINALRKLLRSWRVNRYRYEICMKAAVEGRDELQARRINQHDVGTRGNAVMEAKSMRQKASSLLKLAIGVLPLLSCLMVNPAIQRLVFKV